MNSSSMKRIFGFVIRYLPIILVCCLAAYLRLYKIDAYMTFLGDEGRDVLVVKQMIVDGKFTLLGPTASVGGFFMGPIYYYFMAPFLWAWKLNPVGPAIMVALFGVVTVWLIWKVGSDQFSKRVGLIAALLYTLSPVVISFSRSSWNPNIVPFFALLMMYFLWQVVERDEWKKLFWVGICAGIGIQLHYTFLFLFGVIGVLMLIYGRSRKRVPYIGLGILGFVLGFSPFLAFEFRHAFMNTRAILDFVFVGKDTGFATQAFFGNIRDVYFRIFARLLMRIPDKGMLGNLTPKIQGIWIAWSWCLAVCSGIVLIIRALKAWKKQRTEKINTLTVYVLFFVWLLVPLIFFGVYKKSIYDYYFGIFFPLPFFLTALFFDQIMNIKKIGMILGLVGVIALSIWNWQGRPFIYEPNHQLRQVERISQEIVNHAEGKPFNFALITGGNSDHAYRYFFEIWNKSPVTIENAVIDPERRTVTDQLLIVCEDIFCQPLGNSLWEVAGFGRAEIAGVWDVSVVKIYKLTHYVEPKP